MAEKLLAGDILDGTGVKVDAGDGRLVTTPPIEGEVLDAAAE